MALPSPTFDPRPWPAAVVALLETGAAPVDAVFDMDGTLLGRDIGDELVGWLLERGHHPPAFAARAADHAAYVQAVRGWDTPDQFVLSAIIAQGLTLDELAAQVRACLTARIPLRGPVVALARALDAAGHRVWILTGSAEVVGRAVAAELGLDPDRVVGLRLAIDPETGRITDRVIPPVTCGDGKVHAATSRIGPRVGFTIGDSWTDLPLLQAAAIGVAVPSLDGRLGPLARAAGIPVLLPDDLGG